MRAALAMLLTALSLVAPLCARAQEPPDSPLAQRLRQLVAVIAAEPQQPEALFHPAFLAQVPPARIVEILKLYHGQHGAVVATTPTGAQSEFYGEYRFTTDKGLSYPVKLGIDDKPPHLINTLWFGLAEPVMTSVDEALQKLAALPGQVSFAFCRLGDGPPDPLSAVEPNQRLAIGSTFKLYLLGALVSAVNDGLARWDEVVPLHEDWKSWPSGALQDWPAESPLTLHSLAAAAISVSDNTAADHLLHLLDREKVEAQLSIMGHGEPALNVPFLTTREMFRLKELGQAETRLATYLPLDAAGRRAYLERDLDVLPRESFAGINQLQPTAIAEVEWFASAMDLCRAMDWLRRQTARGYPGEPARAILAINPGLSFDRELWTYVGFKGGSEPGVLNLTWLLQHRDGTWYALSAGWNDPAQALDEAAMLGILQGFVSLAGRRD